MEENTTPEENGNLPAKQEINVMILDDKQPHIGLTMEIEKAQLENLLNQLDEATRERETLVSCAVDIMTLMGLIDPETRKVKPEIKSGEESFVPGMLKSLTDVVALLTQSNMPKFMGGDKALIKLETKFAFTKQLIPLIEKYGN